MLSMGCLKLTYQNLETPLKVVYKKLCFNENTVQLWLSVDPLSDEYSSTSPYMYVLGNPIKFIDPNGMNHDEWELNEKTGELKWIKDTPNDVVHIVTPTGKKYGDVRTGEKKEFVGKVISRSSGSEKQEDGTYKTSVVFKTKEVQEKFYNFAREFTTPEWSYAITAVNESGFMPKYNAFSSGKSGEDSYGASYVSTLDKKYDYLMEFGHSHPESKNSYKTSNKDIEHKDELLSIFPKSIFKLGYYMEGVYKTRDYTKDTNEDRTGGIK